MTEQRQYYVRFNVLQRVEHWVMTISFGLLALTGLPQRYALWPISQSIIAFFGGIESTRIIHRWSAIVLGAISIVYVLDALYKFMVLRLPATMLPGVRDLLDLWSVVRYDLGLSKEHPKLPRYNFVEKMEFLAVVWGTILMGLTGFMLWNPIRTTQILPGQFVPAAKIAHSLEAVLAVLAILVWHVYSVHLKTFNWSMFNGKLSRQQMLMEHAAELEQIEAGRVARPAPPEERRRRQMYYFPIAAVIAVVGVLVLYLFMSVETTAIATVPPAETVQVFVRATPTGTLAAPAAQASPASAGAASAIPMIKHAVAGREDCLKCHSAQGPVPFPAGHEKYSENTCLLCHATDKANPLPAAVRHDVEGREDCLKCHQKPDLVPASHREHPITSADCVACHPVDKAAQATRIAERSAKPSVTAAPVPAAGAPAATAAPAASPAATSAPAAGGAITFEQDILPLLTAKCGSCHGAGALGGLNVTDYAALSKGGASGPAFVAGSPDQSLIVTKMKGSHPAVLQGADLQKLVDWIAAGAKNN
jgi:formate dehydrogenase subunit gamma